MKFVLGRVLRTLQNLVAAVLTAAFCFVPAWFAHIAITVQLAPVWVYGAVAGLVFVGAGVTLSFLEKAWNGRKPLGE
ncbi:hypothetical protein [Antarctobacter heliothermus]|uniref:Uncharacterized protein n=1 Tax=Antarctobacter heliothermus TaxID=74033 RepID=A0A239D427_9RHOB|nr:hypothetical protein [Antarctobacter heliothermus]SNS26989.1 hypothetical protein SAMN04488078_100963 [Antarctobacter heliothermus]